MANGSRSGLKPYESKRWYDEPSTKLPLCNFCKHNEGFDGERISCKAFPEGIPHNELMKLEGERNVEKECANGVRFSFDRSKKNLYMKTSAKKSLLKR